MLVVLSKNPLGVTNPSSITNKLQSQLFWKIVEAFLYGCTRIWPPNTEWHDIMFQHSPLSCVHLILARFLCWKCNNNCMCFWVILLMLVELLKNYIHDPLWLQCNLKFVKSSCCNPLNMGIAQHEYLKNYKGTPFITIIS
jgi:hypothetical protein